MENILGNQIGSDGNNKGFEKLIINSKIMNDIILKYYEKTNKLYIINEKDSKIMNFLLKYIFSAKKRNFNFLIRKRQNYNKLNKFQKINFPSILESSKLITKLINDFILNDLFSDYIKLEKNLLSRKIYFLVKLLFINNIISEEDMNIILGYKLILCLYPEKIDFKSNTIININNGIKNIKELYSLFDFLISFIKIKLDDKSKIKLKNVVEYLIKNIKLVLINNNINNIFILAKNDNLFKLINLSKISNEFSSIINPFLVFIYKYKFNIEYIFNDLTEQFTLQKNEKIDSLINYLMAKNSFLNDLFLKEQFKENEIIIENGFMFNNNDSNGIICSLPNKKSKNFPKKGFSVVISFCLMNENNTNKYNIFSFYKKEKNDFINLYIENNTLKFGNNSQKISLIPDIKSNKNYVFWFVFPKDKNKEIIVILNGTIYSIIRMEYPLFEYEEILIGFDKDYSSGKNIANFEGILGTFIFFNECLINDKNDSKQIVKLAELNGYYEMLLNVQNRRDLININKFFDLTLKKFPHDFLNKIEVIISPKSIGNIQDINNINNNYICNYFNYDIYNQGKEYYSFKFVSDDSINNNITYPIEFKNSLLEFLNDHGLIYFDLELHFFIGVLSLKINEKKLENKIDDNSMLILNKEEIKNMNEDIYKICLLFFKVITFKDYLNRLNKDKNIINNFFYTLNDYISIGIKYGFKLSKIILMLMINNLEFLFSNNLLIDNCEFLFIYENYNIEDRQFFETLFYNLIKIIKIIEEIDYITYKDNLKYIFNKIIAFEKLYLEENISKESKKYYSELIQKFLNIFLKKKEFSLLEKYLYNFEKKINEIQSYIMNLEKNNNIFHFEIIDNAHLSEQVKNNEEIEEDNDDKKILDFKKINNIKLIYKSLKNLFIAIDSEESKNNFILFLAGKMPSFINFFKDLIFFLMQKFDFIVNIYQIININEKESNRIKNGYYSELIKSFCIIFLDIIFINKRHKSKSFIRKSINSVKNILTSSKNIENSNNKNVSDTLGESNENNLQNNINIFENNNSIIGKNYEFLVEINISKYIYSCLYYLIFKNKFKKKEVINLIRRIDTNSIIDKFIDKIKISKSDFISNKYYFDLINIIFEKLGKENNNYELFQFCFELSSAIMKKISEFYAHKISEKKEDILGYFFNYKENCLFSIAINKLIKLSKEINNKESSDKIINQKKNLYEQLNNLIKDNLSKIIDNTLFELKDPFYFTLINSLHMKRKNFLKKIIKKKIIWIK